MLAYIGISLLAIFSLIAAIRWGTERAGYSFPKRFWAVCFLSVIVVTMIVPRMFLGILGLGWTLLFSFFLLFLVALWISFAFLPAQKLAVEEYLIVEELSAADESLPPAVDENSPLPVNMDLLLDEAIHNENASAALTNTLSLAIEPMLAQEAEPDNDNYPQSLHEALAAFTVLEQQVATRFDSSEAPCSPERFFEEATVSPISAAFETVGGELAASISNDALFPSLSMEPMAAEQSTVSELYEDEYPLSAAEANIAGLMFANDEWLEPEPIVEEPAPVEMQEPTSEQREEISLLPTQKPEDEENVVGTVERSLPKSDSLEDLLDYALMQRSRKQFSEALSAIQAAVLLYGEKDPDSLPYLIIELANIYKEQGNYEQAIQAFQEGQNQLTGAAFKPWREQFIVSIAYLRIVRNTLIAHHQPMMPIDSISTALKDEIEEEFAEWNRLS